jgi:hypothetical protein
MKKRKKEINKSGMLKRTGKTFNKASRWTKKEQRINISITSRSHLFISNSLLFLKLYYDLSYFLMIQIMNMTIM